jgi:hypothetical protein
MLAAKLGQPQRVADFALNRRREGKSRFDEPTQSSGFSPKA